MMAYIIGGKIAPKPSEYFVRSSIHCSPRKIAFFRMLFDPYLSQNFPTRSRLRKMFRQVRYRRSLNQLHLAPPGTNSSFRLKPSGTGRRGFKAWTIDNGMTIARVQEDIW